MCADWRESDDCSYYILEAELKVQICDGYSFDSKHAYTYVAFLHLLWLQIYQYMPVLQVISLCYTST